MAMVQIKESLKIEEKIIESSPTPTKKNSSETCSSSTGFYDRLDYSKHGLK